MITEQIFTGLRCFFKNYRRRLNHVKTGVYFAKVPMGGFPFSLASRWIDRAPGRGKVLFKKNFSTKFYFFLLRDLQVFL